MLICHTPCDPLCPTSAEGASGFCQTMPPSDRQLMSIGASEHRAFVRAKARFAGPQGSGTHFVHRNAVIPDILPCIVGGIFWRKVPRVLCPSRSPSVRPARSHSLPVVPARPSAASVAAGCEPVSWKPLLPGLPSCLATASAPSAFARCEPFSANRLTPASSDSGFWPGTMAAPGNRLPPAMLLC